MLLELKRDVFLKSINESIMFELMLDIIHFFIKRKCILKNSCILKRRGVMTEILRTAQ